MRFCALKAVAKNVHMTRVNVSDRNGAIALVTLNLEQFKLVRTMMVDSGYTGQNFANEISSLTSAKVIVVKRNELHQFSVIPQRWLIERSFSWLGVVDNLKICLQLLFF